MIPQTRLTIEPSDRRLVVHLLHVPKTGGTALKHALEAPELVDSCVILQHGHSTSLRDVPPGQKAIFFLRDPLTRFVSGFYCRQRKGWPGYDSPWTRGESAAFHRFQSPNELARTLSSPDDGERELARAAMGAIQHLCSTVTCLESDTYLRSRLSDIFYIGFQETLNADFERLKQKLALPLDLRLSNEGVVGNRNPPNLDYRLDDVAVANLRTWYDSDQRILDFCREHAPEVNARPLAFYRSMTAENMEKIQISVPGKARDEYMESRDYSKKAVRSLCYAPYSTLYFDTQGSVRVCCHNHRFPVGNVLDNSINEIWRGARIKVLRDKLADRNFGPGCEFCQLQTAEGCFSDAAMRRFDLFTVSSESPEWPQQLEFSISNVCNLECVMCSGFQSSAIRSRREHLPILPHLYSDSFIQSLREYLTNATWLKFLGGEPFLIDEYCKIWDMMIAHGITTRCHVTTNGTQFNARVERILDRIPMSFAISMDGVRPETVESIRVNANYQELMANARRFRDYTRARKTAFSLTYCLMRQNWREFGEFCAMGDEWDCNVGVNTVRHPPEFGIYTLPAAELRGVLAAMEAEAPGLDTRLARNRRVWFGELERIRAKVRADEASPNR